MVKNHSHIFVDLMIEKVELILVKEHMIPVEYDPLKEKWLDLDGSGSIYLHIIYGDTRPITDVNFYRINHEKGRPDKMVTISLKSIILGNTFKYGDRACPDQSLRGS
jgi:hypothetical protein